MLYGPNGAVVSTGLQSGYSRPEPQPDAEEAVRRLLKSIDTLLDVKWFPYAIINQKYNSFEGRYGLICQWPQNDQRWELYQKGEVEDPIDMLGWFCTDIHDANSLPVSVDSMEQKIVELLGKCDGERMPHTKRMKQIIEKNAKLRTSRKSTVNDMTEDVARTLWNIVGKYDATKVQRIMEEIGDLDEHGW